jgi:hypothetical protein
LKNSIKILSLSIVGLVVVISFFGYQVYQINHNLSILKSNLVLSQETNPNGDNQVNQEANNNEVSEQSEEGSGAGGGASDSQTASQDPITSAFIPDPSSLLSVIIRTSIIAILVFVIVKWLGGKGIGQLSPFGLLIVVGLGSAIGDPMIYNEVSIPQAMVAVIIVVIFFKIIDYLTLRSKRFRESVEPNPILLVDHGQISKIGLEKAKMDKEEFKVEMRLAELKMRAK